MNEDYGIIATITRTDGLECVEGGENFPGHGIFTRTAKFATRTVNGKHTIITLKQIRTRTLRSCKLRRTRNFAEHKVFLGRCTIYLRDVYECRTISKDIIALGYQKFFTPNSDGIYDFWHIIAVENFPESNTYIYDRYGKLLAQLSHTGQGWDGNYHGTKMPSSDYWFRFENTDGMVFTGHFSLKR